MRNTSIRQICRLVLALMLLLISSTHPVAAQESTADPALAEWQAKLSALQADPVFGQQSNSGIDIVSFGGRVWIGSSRGISFTPDSGKTWFTHTNQTGLLANNISGLTVIDDTLWLATARAEVFGSDTVTSGVGLQFTGDNVGDFWGLAPDTSGLLDSATIGPLRNTFDISGADSLMFTANFVGGLIGSADRGNSWRRFNISFADAQYFANPVGAPPVTSRYFSAVVDTAHTDTTIIWAGHAGGVSRFEFIEAKIKPSSSRILDYAYAPPIFPGDLNDSGFIFIGGDRGLTRATPLGYSQWKSVFARDGVGLPSDVINQLHFFGGLVFIGCLDSLDGDGAGFVFGTPSLNFFQMLGGGVIDSVYRKAGARVMDFEDVNSRYLYVAGASAGLFVTADTGLTWTHIVTDSSLGFTAPGWATVNAVRADSVGNLWCGTDAGLMKISINRTDLSGAVTDSIFHMPMFDEAQVIDGTGKAASVHRIEIQRFADDIDTSIIDSTVIWTSNFPVSDSGEFSTYRILPYTNPPLVDSVYFVRARIDQMMHRAQRVYFVGLGGMFEVRTTNTRLLPPLPFNSVTDSSRTPSVTAILASGSRSILSVGDTTHLGSERFFAVSTRPAIKNLQWHISLANSEVFASDTLALYSTGNSHLSGNFVPALAVQYRVGKAPVIWSATRRGDATDQTGGIDVSYLDLVTPPDSTRNWVALPDTSALKGVQVWNFAFDGDAIYAASDSGLFRSPAPESTFTQVDIVSSDPNSQIRLGAGVNGVAIIDGAIWVATDDGFARRSLSDVFFDVFKVNDTLTREAYAYPVPFNPKRDGFVKFHYQVPQNANNASIYVYDFAMNLVRRVTTNVSRVPGQIAHELTAFDKWDGNNGKGEPVAPGIYYFKIEFSNGDTDWGKLAVIP